MSQFDIMERNHMKRIMTVFETRPEAIKMCPLINEMKKRDGIEVIMCNFTALTDGGSGSQSLRCNA